MGNQPAMGEVFRNEAGNWEYRTGRYTAVVNAQSGRLQSLVVEGRELLAQDGPAAAGGQLYAAGQPFTAALVPMDAYDTVGAWDGNFGLWWHFRRDGIKLEYAVNQAETPTLVFVLNPKVVSAVHGPGPLNRRWLTPNIGNDDWAHGEAGVTVSGTVTTPVAFQGLDLQARAEWNGRQAPAVVYALPQGTRVGGEIHIGPAIPDSAARATLTFTGPRWHLFPATGTLEFETAVTLETAEDTNLEVAVVLSDYNTGKILAAPTQTVTFAPDLRRAAACGAPGDDAAIRKRTPYNTGKILAAPTQTVLRRSGAPAASVESAANTNATGASRLRNTSLASAPNRRSGVPAASVECLASAHATGASRLRETHATGASRLRNTSQTFALQWRVPWTQPGVFRGSVRARTPQGTIGVQDFVFLYDLEQWRPELYRPADFRAFWEGQLQAMRAQPLDAKLTPLPEKSNAEVQTFAVEITGCHGRRIKGEYSEPVRPGNFPVILSTPHPGKDLRVGATEPTVMVYGELADVARYRKDIGDLTRSNFLHVYLDYLRWLDFAESRGKADWHRCFAPTGSRGGPMVIAAAALDKRISLVSMNVGTCNRWDWQVRYTSGWGPYMTDRRPGQSEAEFLKVLGYFDPSHFAERVTIPVCASWGLMDGLSPINGQLSMWVNLGGPKFLELREWGGHDNNTPAYSELGVRVRKALFSGQPLPDAGPLGLNWDVWLDVGDQRTDRVRKEKQA